MQAKMPRLNHKKARTGCQRCKARKVKCDEAKPKCAACTRHGVSCEYVLAPSRGSPQQHLQYGTPPSDIPYNARGQGRDADDPRLDPLLEMRLIHEWTAHACKTFSITWQFWAYQAPLIAFEFRHVLDSMLAIAALYASRQPPMQWVPLDGKSKVVPIRDPIYNPAHPERDLTDRWSLKDQAERWKLPVDELKAINEKLISSRITNAGNNAYLAAKRSHEMLNASRIYFDRALDGHRRALNDLSVENIEAVYLTSILVSFYALFVCSESEEDPTIPSSDPIQWLRVAKGTRFICQTWAQLVGPAWIASSGVFYGKPDMSDDEAIFGDEFGRPFVKLLTFAEDFEAMSAEDREIYRQVICYIGNIYKGIVEETDEPLSTCRRLIAAPSKNQPRFIELLESNQPRAWTILAHMFACMKLIAEQVQWFKGIAERQVPRIYEKLPTGWRPMMAWPMAITNGELDREPKETQIDDILSL